jgi:hypothetical protein
MIGHLVDQINKQTNSLTGQLFDSVKEKDEFFFLRFSDIYRKEEEKEMENGRRTRNTTSIIHRLFSSKRKRKTRNIV